MAFCGKCGSSVPEGATSCPQCGAQVGVAAPAPVAMTPVGSSGLQENVAGLLCYLLGWLTGIIFLLIDKRPFVRFHAAQSIVVFGALHILLIVFGIVFGISLVAGGWAGFSIGWAIYRLVDVVGLVLWIVLMIKAYQGEKFRVPVAADVADSIAGKA